MPPVSETKYITNAGWDDVPHISDAEKRHLIDAATSPESLAAARHGIPVSSVGRIYPWDFDRIVVEPFKLPASWPRVFGFDPATNHTGALWAAHDEQTDTVYLYGEYYSEHHIPRLHAQDMMLRGDWIHGVVDPASEGRVLDGRKLIEVYRSVGLTRLHHADNAVQAGITAVTDRIVSGRLKAFSTLRRLRFEWNNYSRDDKGKIVKKNDDLVDCLRYVCFGGLRWATADPRYVSERAGSGSGVADSVAGF